MAGSAVEETTAEENGKTAGVAYQERGSKKGQKRRWMAVG